MNSLTSILTGSISLFLFLPLIAFFATLIWNNRQEKPIANIVQVRTKVSITTVSNTKQSHHVVRELGTCAHFDIIYTAKIIFKVDAPSNESYRPHYCRQNGSFRICCVIIAVQKCSPVKK